MNPRSQHLCPTRRVACGIVVPQLSESANHWAARGFPITVSLPLPHGCPTCQAPVPPAPLASPTAASSKKPRPCSAAASGRRQAPSDAAASKCWLCWPGGPQTATTSQPPDSRDSTWLPRGVLSASAEVVSLHCRRCCCCGCQGSAPLAMSPPQQPAALCPGCVLDRSLTQPCSPKPKATKAGCR